MKNILFSIIIPTHNRASRIKTSINSILGQTYSDFEILIVDDGSTDNTEDVVKSINDPRIRYFKKQNKERAIARNYGILRAQGDYLTFLDSDDLVYPNHFEIASCIIQEQGNPEWFHLGYEVKDEKGKILRQENKRRGNLGEQLLTGNHLSCIGVFVRKDIIQQNLFNEDPDLIGSEDYELWLRLAAQFPLYYSNEITSCVIQHSQRSVISSFDSNKLEKRIGKIIVIVATNKIFTPNQQNAFIAHRYLYLALHLALLKERQKAIKYFLDAIKLKPQLIFHRKTAGFVKNLL